MLSRQINPSKLLGVAAIVAVLAFAGTAHAGAPDRTATAPWGRSIIWIGERVDPAPEPVAMTAAPMRNARKGECPVKLAVEQNMEAQAPSFARLAEMQKELKAIWTAPSFDKEAFLAKRADIAALRHQIDRSRDNAIASAAGQLTAKQRAKAAPCIMMSKEYCPMMSKKKKHHKRRHAMKPASTQAAPMPAPAEPAPAQ